MTGNTPEDEEAFLSKLREHPEDLTTWGIYADWLDEYGNRPATAEVIRRKLNTKYGDPSFLLLTDKPYTTIGYATLHTNITTGEDHILHHFPSGQKGQVFYTSNWMPRKVSKRLIPALHNEGMPLINSNELNTGADVGHYNKWVADTTTVPETHQMSRRESLKRYASSTVARVMGHGQYANETSPVTAGSRLSTVLREIRHTIGKDNPRLQQLTQHALGGSHKGEVYKGIRDELFRTKDPRAVQLARMYNWHKVGEGLEREKHLRDFVNHVAKGTRHEGSSQMFRQFYNGTVHQVNSRGERGGADDRTRALMYLAMQKHLLNQTGREHSYTDIEDALRRLGETEENKEKADKMNGGAKFESPDYQHSAYSGTPKPNHAPDKRQVTDISKRAPGQYRRHRRFNIK